MEACLGWLSHATLLLTRLFYTYQTIPLPEFKQFLMSVEKTVSFTTKHFFCLSPLSPICTSKMLLHTTLLLVQLYLSYISPVLCIKFAWGTCPKRWVLQNEFLHVQLSVNFLKSNTECCISTVGCLSEKGLYLPTGITQ